MTSRESFARLALERLREKRPDVTATLDENDFSIATKTGDGGASIIYLANFYDDYLAAPEHERAQVVDRMTVIAALVDSGESFDEVRVLLRPRVRPRRFFELDASPRDDGGTKKGEVKTSWYRPLAGNFGVGLAVDRPNLIEYVSEPSKFDVPIEELEAIALANLRRAPAPAAKPMDRGVWLYEDDAYVVERILLPDAFDDLDLDGDPVVFIAAGDCLLVVGSNDAPAQQRALALASQRLDFPRGLVDFGIVRRDGTWCEFLPDDAIGETQRLRTLMYLGGAYASQRDRYRGEPMAEFRVHMTTQLSVTRWIDDGAASWLPWTSVIELDDGTGKVVPANWEDIVKLVPGALEQVPDLWPERYVTRRFPPPDIVAGFRGQLEEPAPSKRPLVLALLAVIAVVVYLLLRGR